MQLCSLLHPNAVIPFIYVSPHLIMRSSLVRHDAHSICLIIAIIILTKERS